MYSRLDFGYSYQYNLELHNHINKYLDLMIIQFNKKSLHNRTDKLLDWLAEGMGIEWYLSKCTSNYHDSIIVDMCMLY